MWCGQIQKSAASLDSFAADAFARLLPFCRSVLLRLAALDCPQFLMFLKILSSFIGLVVGFVEANFSEVLV